VRCLVLAVPAAERRGPRLGPWLAEAERAAQEAFGAGLSGGAGGGTVVVLTFEAPGPEAASAAAAPAGSAAGLLPRGAPRPPPGWRAFEHAAPFKLALDGGRGGGDGSGAGGADGGGGADAVVEVLAAQALAACCA
jgi:hypothetical protein